MTAALVYKTSSPRAIAWFRDVSEREAAAQKLRKAYINQLTADFGPVGKRYSYSSKEIDHRPLMRNSKNEVTDVYCRHGEQPPKGSGWRLDSNTGLWRPDLRSKAGKEREAELAALAGPDSRSELSSIGAAGMAWPPGRLYRCGINFREETGELFVSWGSKDCDEAMMRASALVDDVTWDRVPLSEWHAWREQVEAKQQPEAAA